MLKMMMPIFLIITLLTSNVYAGPDHDVAGKKPGDIIGADFSM
jgi:hypothetical protein